EWCMQAQTPALPEAAQTNRVLCRAAMQGVECGSVRPRAVTEEWCMQAQTPALPEAAQTNTVGWHG
ncbi:MAG: hypothetical protein QM662_14575, partial [Gordonia sp. (in: high G+C Gram-positive bacteria)]